MAKDNTPKKDEVVQQALKQAKSAYIAKTIAKVVLFVASGIGLVFANVYQFWGMAFTFSVICAISAFEVLYGN